MVCCALVIRPRQAFDQYFLRRNRAHLGARCIDVDATPQTVGRREVGEVREIDVDLHILGPEPIQGVGPAPQDDSDVRGSDVEDFKVGGEGEHSDREVFEGPGIAIGNDRRTAAAFQALPDGEPDKDRQQK